MLKKITTRSVIYSLIVLLIYFVLNALLTGHAWDGMVISKSALTVEYCEFNNVDRFFHQSMNTYSNIVYFFFGIFICQLAWEDQKNRAVIGRNRLEQFPGLSYLIGGAFIYLSVGSAFFHASLTWVGQRVDMNGTYGLSIALLAICLYQAFYKWTLTDRLKTSVVGLLILLIVAFYPLALFISSSILLPVFILSIWLLTLINYVQFRKQRSILLAISSITLILIAFKIRQLDVQKINCDPYSVCQGHSVWHLLAGLSSFCGYAFFRFTPTPNRQ
ncbi:ceramidase domain-containing protein [Fibrella aquatilis]|uniref:Ceramidase domain-containing protein n=1 Tax=Fibrella aquatilis TaxID=2817059 RepID=A0A939JVQ0_9BACT|nr:ceramidase domain-containing protein [Fibrella aquatilis]MBO0931087.1 ceramidase domain-containing protein [Fibrella aquatilis]